MTGQELYERLAAMTEEERKALVYVWRSGDTEPIRNLGQSETGAIVLV